MSDNDFSREERGDRGGRYERRGGSRGRDRDQDNDMGEDLGRGGRRGRGRTRSYYCPEGKCFDYKEIDTLLRFVGETGKIKPRRQTGNCARCQRELAREIKRARHLALLPFVEMNDNF